MIANIPRPMQAWLAANRRFLDDFRQWLRQGGYGDSTLKLYAIAARLALELIDKPCWAITDSDLQQVWGYVHAHKSEGTSATYRKGLAKLSEFLAHRCKRQIPRRTINWDHYLNNLPDWLAKDVRSYVAHCQRTWVLERRHRATLETLSHLTRSLRWMSAHASLDGAASLTPNLWFDYTDSRLGRGIKPATINRELADLHRFVQFLADEDRPVCERILRVKPLPVGPRLPRDVPVDQLRLLLDEIDAETTSVRPDARRMGILDRAWFLLMLYCGLRVGEVRHLLLTDLDLQGRKVRVVQSKGLKDRVIPIAPPATEALVAYLQVRGPAATDHVFIRRHAPLSTTYCNRRLRTYGRRCAIHVTPHQLRHSCATLLLNAGAPVLAVQAILGHRHVDTTLEYARLYDGTLATDYYRAVAQVESRMEMQENVPNRAPDAGQLLALVDSLFAGTLSKSQQETMRALRNGVLALAERMDDRRL